MDRQPQTSHTQSLFSLTRHLSWRVGLFLAVTSWYALNDYSTHALGHEAAVHHDSAFDVLAHAIALSLQYLIPAMFVLLSIVSFVTRVQSLQQADKIPAQPLPLVLPTGLKLQAMIQDLLCEDGYTAVGIGNRDERYDFVLYRRGEKCLVSCHEWRAAPIGISALRELLGAMLAEDATHGIIANTGTFTEDARRLAKERGLRLMDGADIRAWMASQRELHEQPAAYASAPAQEALSRAA